MKVLVIVGSVRARRIGPAVAAWIAQVGREIVPGACEVVDLREWPLEMEAEEAIPATGVYQSEPTRAWSRKVSEAAGFVFVSPQYNWGYPAALKNAIDHLYKEWAGKPALIVTYGGHGGDKCAAQLRVVLEGGVKMKPMATQPQLVLSRERIVANEGAVEPAREFASHLEALKQGFSELAAALAG